MYLRLTFVRMEDIAHLTFHIDKRSTVTDTDQPVALMQHGIAFVLFPRAERRIRCGKAYRIVLACIAVCRINQIIDAILFKDGRTFHYFGKNQFPRFFGLETLCQCFFLDLFQVLFQLRASDDIAIVETNEI